MRVVFLGTPQIAAAALEILLNAQNGFQIVGVVSQPPARAVRGNELVPSPVHALALQKGIPVLAPESARETSFIEELKKLKPDLCITAAYGNVLPKEFLEIPQFGTLNIHPSLLPLYRGAAPVQRAVEDGVKETGVSILYTVEAMDAGPIVAQKAVALNGNEKAPSLLAELFEMGAHMLVEMMPAISRGEIQRNEQDHTRATKAKKIKPEEGVLDFTKPALLNHNKVRGFAGWPGTRAKFEWDGKENEVKVITTRFGGNPSAAVSGHEVVFHRDALCLKCGDGQILEIIELQAPGKKAVPARDFWNGVKTKTMRWV